jgi:ribokinase
MCQAVYQYIQNIIMNEILVIGSSNTDMVIKTEKLPCPGETVVGGTFMVNSGGKGANQAVSAARLGGAVTIITKRGNDLFGNKSIGLLMREGIDTQYIVKDSVNPSGVALISVDSEGHSSGVTAPGSNNFLYPEDISENVFVQGRFGILLLQLEIPMKTIEYAATSAFNNGIKVILNPAPEKKLSEDLLKHIWLLTPNESEAEVQTGIKITDIASADKAAAILIDKGVRNAVISLGARGAYVRSENFTGLIPAVKVQVADITAVGDVFNGALAVAFAEGKDFRDAVIFANKAASISATRVGAQASAPYRKEISDLHNYAKTGSYAHFSFIREPSRSTGISI